MGRRVDSEIEGTRSRAPSEHMLPAAPLYPLKGCCPAPVFSTASPPSCVLAAAAAACTNIASATSASAVAPSQSEAARAWTRRYWQHVAGWNWVAKRAAQGAPQKEEKQEGQQWRGREWVGQSSEAWGREELTEVEGARDLQHDKQ